MKKINPKLIPLIRKMMPKNIAADLVDVQPMANKFSDLYEALKIAEVHEPNYAVGERVHDFIKGWLRWDGHELIPEELYWELKIKKLL